MFKIFYVVALGSYVTFSPNLSKFSGERRGVTFLTNLSEIYSPFYEGGGGGGGGLQNKPTEDDENFDKSELI